MKRNNTLSRLTALTLAVTLTLAGCTQPNEPVSSTPTPTTPATTAVVTTAETAVTTTEVSGSGEVDSSDDETDTKSDEITVTNEEITESETILTQELITEPLDLTLSNDLTQEDINELKQYTEIRIFIKESIDISLLAELDNLQKLSIHQSSGYPAPGTVPLYLVSDFSFLSGMNLKILNLDFGGFDVKLNEFKLDYLEEFNIYYANIIDEDDLIGFPSLKILSIQFSDAKTIDPFCSLNLEEIFLHGCSFGNKNLDRINEIHSLKSLRFTFCWEIEFTTLSGLTELEVFSLFGGNINYDIELIYELTWLEVLSINYSFITREQLAKFREINPTCYIAFNDGQTPD